MDDDSNVSRAFNLLREATVLLSGSSEVPRNVNENTQSSDSSTNTASGGNMVVPSGPVPDSSVQTQVQHFQSTPVNNHQNVSHRLQSVACGSNTNTSGPTGSHSSLQPFPSTPVNTNQNVLRNFQSLFSPYSRGISSLGSSRGTVSRPIRSNRRQRQQHATREETWTHEVFCLASSSQKVAPNRELKQVLQRAGLGRMKIRFNAKGDPQSFKETLEEAFPKLMWGGGFELLRRGSSGNELVLLQPPPIGYSVQFLKTSSGIGQAVLYVRPIQSDLDTNATSEMMEEEIHNEDVEKAPKVSCQQCGACVPITLMRNHLEDCVGSGSTSNQDTEHSAHETNILTGNHPDSSISDQVEDIRMSIMLPSLKEIFPDKSEDSFRAALVRSQFNLELASEIILNQGLQDNLSASSPEAADNDSDLEELLDRPLSSIQSTSSSKLGEIIAENGEDSCDINELIAIYRNATIDSNVPRQLFSVCRSDGEEDMKADILATYKNQHTNLLARPKVRFEGEEGLGAGPLREFFHVAVKIAQEGIGFTAKPVIYFEGDIGRKLPVHNPALRHTGSFRAIGRILGHSFLHGGPSFFGLSEAVRHYFTSKTKQDISSDPPPLEIEDIPDIDLQMLLRELLNSPANEKLPDEISSNLLPYLLEAGVDIELLSSNREVVVQCLLLYNIIEKRKIELDDILVGLESVGLKTFIERHPRCIGLIFPTQEEADIVGSDLKSRLQFHDESLEVNSHAMTMLLQYIDCIEKRKEVGADLLDLCCFWTGWNVLPPRSEKLNVIFDKTSELELPMAECCFNNLIVPVVHRTFEKFKEKMDIALKHGSKGFTFS